MNGDPEKKYLNYFTTYGMSCGITDLIRIYEEREGNENGGSLHIVLEDGNVQDSSLTYCVEYALEQKDFLAAEIATMLLQFNPEDRCLILCQTSIEGIE
jgi:hypothetical protein